MRYQVKWRRPALDSMASIVRAYPERKDEFAAALQSLSRALSTNPVDTGEGREPPYRVWFFGPLTVHFRPDAVEQVVFVTQVRLRQS
jgi:hypothetical protein